MFFLAKENLSVPGLYYDEAVFAGMAKDFLTGQIHGQHMPGHVVTSIFGRPFPVLSAAAFVFISPLFGGGVAKPAALSSPVFLPASGFLTRSISPF